MKQDKPAPGIPPAARAERPADGPSGLERWLLRRLLKSMGEPGLRVRLWDGSVHWGTPDRARVPMVTVSNRRTLWRQLTRPRLHFGHDYSAGHLEIDNDLSEFMRTLFRATPAPERASFVHRLLPGHRPENRPAMVRPNIHPGHKLGTDFCRLWLDPELSHSCAYFPDPAMDLERAQHAKMELICRKLRLQPGQTVVEAGCGWGALARYMAGRHGVRVLACDVSRERITYARQRAQADGIDHRVQFVEDDYRNIAGNFDAFVSVGMLEHLDASRYRELGASIQRCLKPTGLGLLHSVGHSRVGRPRPWSEVQLFPGVEPPTLTEMLSVLEPNGLSVLDVENLRPHGALTLQHWRQRFEQRVAEPGAQLDEYLVRAWRLYLAAAIAGFDTGRLQLFQLLFTPWRNAAGAWNRRALYDPMPVEPATAEVCAANARARIGLVG